MLKHLVNSWLVILLAVAFGGALAGLHLSLKERIAANQLRESLSQVPALVPGATRGEPAQLGGLAAYKALKDEDLVGWVVVGRGQGFADVIQVLIGVDAKAERLTGLYVLDQKETPGLGNKIKEDPWRGQFAGKSAADPLAVTKGDPTGNQIKAVTGATISSAAVSDIVNATLVAFRAALAKPQQ